MPDSEDSVAPPALLNIPVGPCRAPPLLLFSVNAEQEDEEGETGQVLYEGRENQWVVGTMIIIYLF